MSRTRRDELDLDAIAWVPWATPTAVGIVIVQVLAGGTRFRTLSELHLALHELERLEPSTMSLDLRNAIAERDSRLLEMWESRSARGVLQKLIDGRFLRPAASGTYEVDASISLAHLLDLPNRPDRRKQLHQLRMEW